MADTLDIKVEGLRELQQAFEELGPETSKAILGGALRQAGEVLAREVAIAAPVAAAPHRRGKAPGALQRSVKAVLAWASNVSARVKVIAEPYAYPLARGHAIIARGPSRKGLKRGDKAKRATLRSGLLARRRAGALGRVAPRPFVQPVFQRLQQRLVEIFASTARKTIDETRALRRIASRGRNLL